MADFIEQDVDQEDPKPKLPKGYEAIQKTPPLPKGYEPLKKKESFDTDPHSYLKLFGNGSSQSESPSTLQLPYQGTTETNNLPSTSNLKLGATDARIGGEDNTSKERIASPKALGKALLTGAASGVSGTLKSIGIAAKRLDLFGEYKGKKAEELATYKAGKWIDEQVKDLVGELSPEEQKNFSVHLASGFGQMGALMLGGAGSRALRMSEGLTGAFMGAAMQGSSEYENAVNAGATPDQAAKVFWINSAIGSAQAIPMMGAFRKLDKYTGGLATGALAKQLASTAEGRLTSDMVHGAITNAAQMAGQTILTNVVAKNTYDATRDVYEGLGESLATGGIIGATMHGITSGIREKRAAGNLTPEENADLDKAETFANEKINEVEKADKQADNIVNHATKVKENLADKGLSEDAQDNYVAHSLVEKLANEKAEKLTDPTLIKEQKEIAKDAAERKEQLLQGKKPEEIVTEKEQKEIEEKEKNAIQLQRLKEDNELENKKFNSDKEALKKEISGLDGRTEEKDQKNKLKADLEKLELKQKRANEDHQKAVEKLTPKEEVVETKETDPIKQASEAAWVDIQDPNIAKLFAENPEQGLKEAAQQLNASNGEAETARKVYGDTISDIALKLYPKEKVTLPEEVTPLAKLEKEYRSKSVDELVALKKELYPNPDIESAMSPEEKLLNKVTADKFSEINQQIRDKKKPQEVEQPKEKSKQENVNDLVDRVNTFNKKPKNAAGRNQEINEIKVAANELGLKFDDRAGKLVNEKGKKVQKRNTDAPSKEATNFDINNYSDETKIHFKAVSENENSLMGLPIKGRDGRQLTQKQLKDAIKSVKDGKPNIAAQAIFDFLEHSVSEGGIEVTDPSTGRSAIIPMDEYMAAFKEPIKPLTDEEIHQLNYELTEDSFNFETDEHGQEILHKETEQPSTKGTTTSKNEVSGGKETTGTSTKETPKEKLETEVGKPPTEGEPPIEPPKPPKTEEGDADKLSDKGILNRLHDAKNVPEASKKGFEEKGLKYEPQSHEEAEILGKAIVEDMGIDAAVTLAEANRVKGGVRSAIFAASLDKLAEQEAAAKTPAEKLDAAKKFAEIGIRYDEFSREQGRDISQIGYFYKKSPLGIQMMENAKRTQQFDEWAKPKEKNWRDFFEELKKDPEFEKVFKENVKEELKKERQEARKERIKKVDKFFDDAKDKFNDRGAVYSTIIPPKVITAALEGMKQAYHAGEKVVELVQKAIDEISAAMGNAPWDKEKFRKEWEEKLKDKTEKKTFTDEELKAKLLDKFRNKLKGLSDKQKEDVVRKSFAKIVEAGALDYADFRKIIAEVTGRGEMTDAEAAQLKELVKQTNAVDEAGKKAREVRTQEARKQFREAEIKAGNAARELNKLLYNRPNIVKRLTSLMQLNTLGIPALVNNPIYNIINHLGIRLPVGVVKSGIERVIQGGAKLFGKEYIPETNIFSVKVQREFFRKLGLGTRESVGQFLTGLNRMDYLNKEIQGQQIRPVSAMKDLWAYSKGEKNLTKAQVIDKIIQASPPGITAEIIARTLNLGDKPQRFAAEGAQAATFAKKLGLKDIDYDLFIDFPREEAYRAYKAKGLSDAEAAKKADHIKDTIVKEGERSTFQQDNMLSDVLNRVFGGKDSGVGGAIKAIAISPYIKIPSNAYWSYYNIVNPEVAMLQSMIYAGKAAAKARGVKFSFDKPNSTASKDLHEAKYWLAHAAVGMATRGVIMAMVNAGIYRSGNTGDDTKKEREGEQFYENQGTMNLSKLWAWMRGKDPNEVKNGLLIQDRWAGHFGTVGNTIARKEEEKTPEQKQESSDFWDSAIGGMELYALQDFEQGVFGNTQSLLSSMQQGIKTGDMGSGLNNWGVNTLNMFTNIVHPAASAQIEKALLPYYTKQKADSFMQEVKNSMLTRSAPLRYVLNQYPPSKVGIWGDRLDKKDNVPMRLFGISRANDDNFAQPIYEDYKKTNDIGFFPPAVMPEVNNVKLNADQSRELEEFVGHARKELTAPYINDMAELTGYEGKKFSQLSLDQKKKSLQTIYELGAEEGKIRFVEAKEAKGDKSFSPKEKTLPERMEDARAGAFRSKVKYEARPNRADSTEKKE